MTRSEIISRLPQPIENIKLAELVGTPKQIEWAKKIRTEILISLRDEIRDITKVFNYMGSVDKMVEWVEGQEQSLGEPGAERAIEHINLKKQQYDRLVEIAANADAKFWIDNRMDQLQNFRNKTLKSKVVNG